MSAPERLPTFPPIGVKVSTDVELRASGVRAGQVDRPGDEEAHHPGLGRSR